MMRTNTREATIAVLPSINTSEIFYTEEAIAEDVEPGAVVDLQDDCHRSQEALLRELHIQDKVDALTDPHNYFQRVAWSFMERCYDRLVWSEARKATTGSGYIETAQCAVFDLQNQSVFPVFKARISFRTELDEQGGIRLDDEGRPHMYPFRYVVESALRQNAMKPHAVYRYSYEDGKPLMIEETEYMGQSYRHDTTDPATGEQDELKVAHWLTLLNSDTLCAIRMLEQPDETAQAEADHAALVAMNALVHRQTI